MYLLAPLLSRITKHLHLIIPKKNWLFLTIPISILVHILVGNITPLTKNFLNIHSHYPLKILIIALLLLGLQGIRKTKK
ncbi:MAG: hypothetical protein GW939_02795 [Candidatus Magasanikbacteria bacterium]|uniref:Uncharacterized protein n=1 Tax=Candidatus Magasanikbacteria bacterium CG10_big_fil_rev_8_21_14_0_10_38_6 TaxID=1974647 RepID=A0A2M6P0R9_9BACT|nr:hypothetical protein [Candidatus Magasanikbacteria bacterium]PIR77297.1 MAG: hypothetical protein COU30_03250 [Candidatus Magasanikbacteria bacterium CG10_big_fil_rev_8_21_14_0_10_38_6]